MAVQHPLLAPCLIQLRYTGPDPTPVYSFDANGAPPTLEGQLTLISVGAVTIDINTYSTLELLVDYINTLDGWEARGYPGLAASTIITNTALGTQRPLADATLVNVTNKGNEWTNAIIPTNAYEVIPSVSTTALLTACAIATDNRNDLTLTMTVQGTAAGCTDNVLWGIVSNPAGSNDVTDLFDAPGTWDTEPLEAGLSLPAQGATALTALRAYPCAGIPQIKLAEIGNVNAWDVWVSGYLNIQPIEMATADTAARFPGTAQVTGADGAVLFIGSDDAAFAAGSTGLPMLGAATTDTVNTGDWAVPRLNTDRRQEVVAYRDDGSEVFRALADYAPTVVAVGVVSQVLLAADASLNSLQLTNQGANRVWLCHANQTAVVGSGFFILPNYGTITFTEGSVPSAGLNAIAETAPCNVAIGRG